MGTYDAIIQELEQKQKKFLELWSPVGMRQVRVMRHPPGAEPVDITTEYADANREAGDALNKAIQVLKNLNA